MGVSGEIAERVLGHVTPGVENIYNRHAYIAEKADALRRLAGLIETILNAQNDDLTQAREAAE